MSLRGIAQATLAILEQGWYTAPSGARREIAHWQKAAERGTRLFTPEELARLLEGGSSKGVPPEVEVSAETTQQAARRLVQDRGLDDLVLFAIPGRALGGANLRAFQDRFGH